MELIGTIYGYGGSKGDSAEHIAAHSEAVALRRILCDVASIDKTLTSSSAFEAIAMFDAFLPSAKRMTIDIDAVRDTLRYIESDLRQDGQYARLAETLRTAIVEIERIGPAAKCAAPPVYAAHFRPIDM